MLYLILLHSFSFLITLYIHLVLPLLFLNCGVLASYVSKANRDRNEQGCGNATLDLSDLVPFHSGQVINFYFLVLGQV